MSRTIGSPAWMTRSDASWWRRRRVRPGGDDREQPELVALGDEPLADLARDVGLGPADEPAGRDRGHDAIGGVGRLAEQGDLVGVLDHPEVAQDRRRGLEAGARPEMRLEPQEVHGPQRRPRPRPAVRASPAGAGMRPAMIACASSSSPHVTISTGVRRPCSAAPRSSRGTTMNGAWPRMIASIVSRSSGIAS